MAKNSSSDNKDLIVEVIRVAAPFIAPIVLGVMAFIGKKGDNALKQREMDLEERKVANDEKRLMLSLSGPKAGDALGSKDQQEQ